MTSRLPLSVVVSAVLRLREPRGATSRQVMRYLHTHRPGQAVHARVHAGLSRAVREGFLGRNGHRYLPVCYKCSCYRGRRARRHRLQEETSRRPPDQSPTRLTALVPSFISKLF